MKVYQWGLGITQDRMPSSVQPKQRNNILLLLLAIYQLLYPKSPESWLVSQLSGGCKSCYQVQVPGFSALTSVVLTSASVSHCDLQQLFLLVGKTAIPITPYPFQETHTCGGERNPLFCQKPQEPSPLPSLVLTSSCNDNLMFGHVGRAH